MNIIFAFPAFIGRVFFFLNERFDCSIKPWVISIVTNYCLMRNKVAQYIKYSAAEDRNFLVNISIEKGSIPVKVSNCPSNRFSICLFVVPDFSWV